MQVVECLLGLGTSASSALELNAVNQNGLTALDLLVIFPSEAGDREIEEIIRNAGGRRAKDLVQVSPLSSFETDNHTPVNCQTSDIESNDLVEYFKFKRGRDSPSDARSALLVIAVLVATATFQVGINPPGGIWQDTDLKGTNQNPPHIAGRSILGSYSSVAFLLFVVFNSIGFSVSLFMINILASNFPFLIELQICLISLYFTYNTAMTTIASEDTKVFIIVFTSILPSLVPFVAKLLRQLIKRVIRCIADPVN